jgi:hypothetical protein
VPKSIIQIDVDDAKFKAFQAEFKKHQDAVKKELPDGWGRVSKAIGASWKSLIGAGVAAGVVVEEVDKAKTKQEKFAEAVQKTRRYMGGLAKDAKETAFYVGQATAGLARWAGILGAVGGVLGGGGLYGIDRLAASSASTRRFAQGTGSSYGGSKAFSLNYGRYVDPESFLSNINDIAHDPSKQFGVGADVANLSRQGLSASDIAVRILPQILQQYRAGGKTIQGAQAYGLTNFTDLQGLNRLDANGNALGASRSQYGTDSARFDVNDPTQQAWQGLITQLDRAGDEIETTFTKGLVKLALSIAKISQGVADAADQFVRSGGLQHLLSEFADGLETFGKYVGSENFKSDIKTFTDAVGWVATGLAKIAHVFGYGSTPATPSSGGGLHNPGNIRNANGVGFRSFGSDREGATAVAQLVQNYGRHGVDTLGGIISTYSPSSENDTARLIKEATRRTGLDANQHLDLNNYTVLGKVVGAILKQEGYKGSSPFGSAYHGFARIAIENNTGGSAIVTSSQLAH